MSVSAELKASYSLYCTMLALKLVVLAALSAIDRSSFPDKVGRKSVSDLKHLAPFWLIASFFLMTEPGDKTVLYLMRAYVLSRFVIAFSYLQKLPKPLIQCAMFVSFAVTGYMGSWVLYYYREAL